jgi:hypothetical protein
MSQYCKRIRGKRHYFGTHKQETLKRYLEQAAYLHSGQGPKPDKLHIAAFLLFTDGYLNGRGLLA